MALLFAQTGPSGEAAAADDDDARVGFEAIPLTEATLHVAESSRHGAPMTMVRGGEERDLAAIVAMGRVRADPFRFHLDRDIDLVQYAITRGMRRSRRLRRAGRRASAGDDRARAR